MPSKTLSTPQPALPEMSLKIFIIGSYFGETTGEIQKNINRAQQAGIELMKKGHLPLVPQSMYAWWEHEIQKPLIMKTIFDWIRNSDAVFVLNLGAEGSGTAQAVDVAMESGLVIFTDLDEIPQLPAKTSNPTTSPFF